MSVWTSSRYSVGGAQNVVMPLRVEDEVGVGLAHVHEHDRRPLLPLAEELPPGRLGPAHV